MTPRAASAAALVASLLLVACSDDSNDRAASTTTTRDATTTTTVAETTTTAAAPCAAVADAPPGGQTATADLDGDGKDDAVRVVETGTGGAQYRLVVELAAGGGAQVDIASDGVTAVALIGGTDIDGDGSAELWTKVGAGASAEIVGLYALDGCTLAPAQLNGGAATFPVGGSVGNTSGVECADGALIALSASSNDGETYATTVTTYRLTGPTLALQGAEAGSVAASSPEFSRFTTFRCGALTL